MTQKPELLKEVTFVHFVYWLALLKFPLLLNYRALTSGHFAQPHGWLPLNIIGEARHCDGIKTTYDGWKYVLMYGSINFEGAIGWMR